MSIKFYRNSESGYEQLIAYYPNFLRRILEIQAILRVQGAWVDDIQSKLDDIYKNCFILSADEETISRWERWLDIYYTKELTLEQRRKVVMSYISGHGHIGGPEIREIVSWYSDATVSISLEGGHVDIKVADIVFDIDNLYEILKRRLPAHLGTVLYAISTLPIDAHPIRLFGSVGNADTESTLPQIELDYQFLQNTKVLTIFQQITDSLLPIHELSYDYRGGVRNAVGLAGADTTSDIECIERTIDYDADLDTMGLNCGSVMETPIPNL